MMFVLSAVEAEFKLMAVGRQPVAVQVAWGMVGGDYLCSGGAR